MSPRFPSDPPATKDIVPEPEDSAPGWKKRRMIRGRWRDPERARKAPRADRTFSIRVTEAELAAFDARIALLGLKRNRALRIAMRRIGGFLEVDPGVAEELRGLHRQLTGIATNINQIAHAANRTHDPDYHAFLAARSELGRVLFETRAALARILDLGARREDGLARLSAAKESPAVSKAGGTAATGGAAAGEESA